MLQKAVEGAGADSSCKFVIGKRLKGSGLRSTSSDRQRVLQARLATLNGRLQPHFRRPPGYYLQIGPLIKFY